MQAALVRWHPPPFFTFCWRSLKKILALCYRIIRIVIPNSFQGVAWACRTVVKLVILFFGLVVLLVGPRIGLPRSILQATWSLLIRLGCVTTEDIVRLGQGAATAATGEEGGASVGAVAGQLIRLGYRNMEVAVAASLLTSTVSSIVSEMFWTTVDLLGLSHYFRSVARHKHRFEAAAAGGGGGGVGVDVV